MVSGVSVALEVFKVLDRGEDLGNFVTLFTLYRGTPNPICRWGSGYCLIMAPFISFYLTAYFSVPIGYAMNV